jgi:hypothetical protein
MPSMDGSRFLMKTFKEFERYNLDYERQHFRYCDTNRRTGEATRDLLLSWFPSIFRPMLKPSVYALLDDKILEACGFPCAPRLLCSFVAMSLKLRGKVLRLLPPRKQASFFTDFSVRSYPNGYDISELGSPPIR